MNITAPFSEVLPADGVATSDEAVGAFAVDGMIPQCVLFPETVDDLSRCLRVADQASLAVMPVGNGTQLGCGNLPQRYDVALSTRRLARLLAHEAADMTVTVEAGATLAEVNRALEPARQHLPLDPPQPEQTTVGAAIATDASGPLRLSQGKVRDLLIGVKVVLADGTLVKGGGRVVKNVAGYDLMKLFTGSFGTLGTVVEATFKLRPRPESEVLFAVPTRETGIAASLALEVLGASLAPSYVEALNQTAAAALDLGDEPLLIVGCGGSEEEINIQSQRLQDLAGKQRVRTYAETEGAQIYCRLRDFPGAGFLPRLSREACPLDTLGAGSEPRRRGQGDGFLGCKLSLLPSKLASVLSDIEAEAGAKKMNCAILSHVGSGIAYVRCGAADDDAVVQFAQRLRAAARQADGWAIFDVLPAHLRARLDTWDAEVPGISLMRGVKKVLDPKGRLSPGRFVGGI
ncbi:MAG: FAD-binding oxidoreductase [Candidatus Binatia bacterium]|jgi:glycolate oxidase FAD binding subunit